MTPAEVYAAIREQCAESSDEFWTEDEIYRLMSEGERRISRFSEMCENTSAFTSVTNTKEYTVSSVLSATIGTIVRVTYDSYPLTLVNINDIDDVEGTAYGGVTIIGQPEYYYRYGGKIGFSPTPDDAKAVSVSFNEIPAAVTTASTAFTIPEEYADYIPDYALYRMFLKDQELRSVAVEYLRSWNSGLVDIKKELDQKKYDRRDNVVVVESPDYEDI